MLESQLVHCSPALRLYSQKLNNLFQKAIALTRSPAAAGDTTRNLVWRLEHGEGPERLRPAVVVLQIGTNDLTQPEHPLARAALSASVSLMRPA